ncbi:MAG: hypothetical protein QME42_05880 [bacterium]|nr:hypothetical protein [bacterium]
MAAVAIQLDYTPATINISKLANLLVNLTLNQRNELELLLDENALKVLEESDKDIKQGRTIAIEKW